MQLTSLTSNHDSFHPVKFKPGVNLIVGEATEENKEDLGKTFNGVGKSLLIKLIDFCLGCDNIKDFEEKLPNWSFTLEFTLGDKTYSATRHTSKQNRIYLNGEEMPCEAYKDFLFKRTFEIEEEVEFITWRSLISRFVRTRKDSYISYDSTFSRETDFQILINKAFLLGLDLELIRVKRGLKVEQDRIDKLKENIEGDEIFKKFFTQDKDVDIELANLKDEIGSLTQTLENFTVSDDYYKIQKEADDIKYDTQIVKNKISLLENSLKNIRSSLLIRGDIDPESVEKLYAEAQAVFPDAVKKKIEEVTAFHKSLFEVRKRRLMGDLVSIRREVKSLNKKRDALGAELDEKIKFLGEHKALDEFVGVNRKLTELSTQAEKLKSYKGIIQEYENEVGNINLHLKKEDVKTNDYILQANTLIEQNLNTFRVLAKEFYSEKAGGITVKNNIGKNQIRFDIVAHIDDDTSDGVGEVKIFCYDLTLLLTRHAHLIRFVVHDSRLFSNMDPRQRATLFRLANQHSASSDFQYIATANQDQLEPLRGYYSEEEFKALLEENVVLRLTDESNEARLLGVQVNLNYEK